jgi:hypothetical protein
VKPQGRRGQATTEYLVVVAFIAVALGLAMAGLYRGIHTQTGRLVGGMARELTSGGTQ